MRVTDVRYVLAVVKSQNLTKAAALENISAPAMSEAIRRVEADLSTELFVRSNRGMVLTAGGRRLIAHLEAVAEAESKLRQHASNNATSETVRIGTVLGYGVAALQRLLSNPPLLDGKPATIEIGASGWDDVTAGLVDDTSHCAILIGPTEYDSEITSHVVAVEARKAVMSIHCPLAGQDSVTLAEIDRVGWVSINPSSVDTRWFEYWRGDDSRPGPPPPGANRAPCESPNELLIALHNAEGICTTLDGVHEQFAFGDLVLRPVSDLPPVPVRLGYKNENSSSLLEDLAKRLRQSMSNPDHS